ncbi:MAG: PTS sugar transporter subunit IIA [Chlamydiales bacterium]|nr:PTS sugar transporter subunit IIA [Chlamydiales bacterium]
MEPSIESFVNCLSEDLVINLKSDTRDQVLDEMIDLLSRSDRLVDREAFHQAILEREKIVSTGIGMGVAFPHAKLPDYDDFFIVIGIHKDGVDWNALDGNPVKLVFMIGGPDDRQTQYLKILSSLTMAIKDENVRKKVKELEQASEIIDLFRSS